MSSGSVPRYAYVFLRSFDDGFPNLFINNAQEIRGQHVAFLASFSSPAVIFEQLSVIFALPRLFVASFSLVLPFFPTGSFERMEEEGDVATAFTMARILSNIPISRGGPTSLVIYDIHALQVNVSYILSSTLDALDAFSMTDFLNCFFCLGFSMINTIILANMNKFAKNILCPLLVTF